MRCATTVAGLGVPTTNGELGILRVNSGTSIHQEFLIWNQTQQAWASRPRPAMRQIDSPWGMQGQGVPASWSYPFSTEGLGDVDTGYGFQIHAITDAAALCSAGLRLQERLNLFASGGATGRIALNWFTHDTGDQFLSPTPTNIGVVMNTPADSNAWHFLSSGWQNSPAAVASKSVYYPELYVRDSSVKFRTFTADYRWVGGTLGTTGGSDSSDGRPPVQDALFSWLVADNVPRANGAAVDVWPDASGFSRGLGQSVAGKRPLLVRGAQNGHAVVRFDGTDDFLQTLVGNVAQPVMMFFVLKQYGGGPTQQVWHEGGAGASPLVYRSSATTAVGVWAGGGGGDLTYNRGSSWPSPMMCVGVYLNGASSAVWENGTLVASGSATSPGTNGIVGMTLGAAFDGTLPAQIDVAEVIIYYRTLTGPERISVEGYLNTKYTLF